MNHRRTKSGRLAGCALAAIVGAAAAYGHTLGFGLWWDDYHALRPWTLAQLAGAWHGSWDPYGIWPVYFRPLSTAFYALGFAAFGVNGAALHALSIALVALVGVMTGLFVAREVDSASAGAFAAAVYATHPAIAYAEGPWFFLATHTLCSIVVVSGLLVWQRARLRPTVAAWCPIFGLTLAGVLVQEDVVMLAPGLVAAQALRSRWQRDAPAPSRGLIAASIALVAGVFVVRYLILGQLGGRPLPTPSDAALNLLRAVVRVLLVFQRQQMPVFAAASLLSMALLAILIQRLRRALTTAGGLVVPAMALYGAFALPLVFASSPSRYHLLALCASLLLAAGVHAWRTHRSVRTMAMLATLGVFAMASRQIVSLQAPCTAERLWSDQDVLRWPPIIADEREWLVAQPAECASGHASTLVASVDRLRWDMQTAGGAIVVLAADDAKAVTFVLHGVRNTTAGLAVTLNVDGDLHHSIVSASGATVVELPLHATVRAWLRGMHRIDISADDAGPGDTALALTKVTVTR